MWSLKEEMAHRFRMPHNRDVCVATYNQTYYLHDPDGIKLITGLSVAYFNKELEHPVHPMANPILNRTKMTKIVSRIKRSHSSVGLLNKWSCSPDATRKRTTIPRAAHEHIAYADFQKMMEDQQVLAPPSEQYPPSSSKAFVGMTKHQLWMSAVSGRNKATPLPAGIKFDATFGPLLPSPKRYRRLVGRLLYLGFSRPDISFAVQQVSQFIQHHREAHWDAALHLVLYLKGTSTLDFFFPSSSSFQLSAFSDSDWASCIDTRRSVTGFYIFMGGSLISWKTKKHATVSR
ncbi:Retrovirus-related Pol polyprotein from transposon RE2 [Sesamum angolense]|uniref:Retrovirus-related Pol polyprotein from transposon RE2 n=1 Tax=Sesamum angolense TaxID=2727404 RepID=A0AAE2BLB3_9LAMI|nr:Retrovirus-related Pol polyprotein from transposon RE2 [Sesamum angolense]